MFDRITSDPAILGGKPIVRGTRISVELILEWVASGATRDDIVRQHPHLTAADVEQAMSYAASAVRDEVRTALPARVDVSSLESPLLKAYGIMGFSGTPAEADSLALDPEFLPEECR